MGCCGVDSYTDFLKSGKSIPWSCCGNPEGTTCSAPTVQDKQGCVTALQTMFTTIGTALGGLALGIAGVEVNRYHTQKKFEQDWKLSYRIVLSYNHQVKQNNNPYISCISTQILSICYFCYNGLIPFYLCDRSLLLIEICKFLFLRACEYVIIFVCVFFCLLADWHHLRTVSGKLHKK